MKKTRLLSLTVFVLFIACLVTSCNQEIKRCVVTFKNGGALVKQIIVNEGETLNEDDIPKVSEDGMSFVGWFLDDEEYKFNTPITKDIVLEAKWVHDEHIFENDDVCIICEGTQCGEDVVFFFDENTKTLTLKGTGSTFDYEILDDKMGTISPRPWDDIFLEIENIEVENGITKIGDMSFAYFSNEKPYLSKIKTVEMPFTLKEIGLYAFSASSIENLVIPDGVTSIGNGAFAGCGILEEITIPASIETIGGEVFAEADKLSKVNFLGTEEQWVQFDWKIYDTNVYFKPNKKLLISCYHDNDGKIIAQYLTKYGKAQEEIVVPNYIGGINGSTFKDSCAKTIYIPNSVKNIESNTFSMFNKTTTIKIDVSEDRYHEIFKGDVSKTNVILEDGKPPKFNISMHNSNITFVGLNEIDETMTSITIPSYVEKIAKDAFVNAPNLKEIHIDKTEDEFHQMYPYVMDPKYTVCLKDNEPIKFNMYFQSEYYYGFVLDSLTDVSINYEGELIIPSYVKNINATTFTNIQASSIVFPEYVNCIKISKCPNLQSLTINNTNIDSFIIYARDISGCGKLKEIKYAGKISDWEHIYDSEITSGQEIIVHCSDGDITSYI